jgi:heme/copper-type cytochrome/quinol oxidase subunit 4
MADPKREVRKHLMIMVALILAVDTIAVVVYRTMGIEDASRDRRTIFTAVWTLVSLVVVLNGLYRIRTARNISARSRR